MVKKIWSSVWHYRSFSVALLVSIIALILDLSGSHTIAHWLLAVTAGILVLPLLWGMVQDVRDGTYGIDLLAATAIITSIVLGQYWAGMVIVLMLTGGEALEDYAGRRAQSELSALLKHAPHHAHVIHKNQVVDVPIHDVRVGDKIIIKPGEVVPVDAIITEGTADFDESSLTGESLPQPKQVDDQLLSGSVSQDGAVTARAIRTAADSQYEQIIKLVRGATHSQAPFVRLADRYAIPFTVIAFAIAGAAWAVSGEAIRFLSVLVVATPCPLILAAPIAVISGISRAAKQGIIIKNGGALERFAEAKTIAFDKTGTLTRGELAVDQTVSFKGYTKTEVLGFAASAEQSSNHVLARAIQTAALIRKAHVPKTKNVREFPGRGLAATTSGKRVLVGRFDFMAEENVEMPPSFKPSTVQQTATFIALGDELIGYITFKDEIRDESKYTLQTLGKLGMQHRLMITGDNARVAKTVAKQLGIEDVVAEALPGDKLLALERVQNRPVAFVGDGVNDAPVLTASDIGIALGASGSTAASESADMVIMQNDLSKVATAYAIAKRTFAIAKQSILVGIALSVILMVIFASGRFLPIYGAVIQELVDVVVIFNALRAHSNKPILPAVLAD
jgi:heavy metal translocating P-type ATPase